MTDPEQRYVKRDAQQARYSRALDLILIAALLALIGWCGYTASTWLVRAVWSVA